jgi:hypothetical protein
MSALVYHGARYANASTAGVTAPDQSNAGMPPPVDTVEAANLYAHGGLSPLDSWLGGGIHPETPLLTAPSHLLTIATDSLPGRHGGLVPRSNSTVAPGSAGSAASARSTLGKIRTKLGV